MEWAGPGPVDMVTAEAPAVTALEEVEKAKEAADLGPRVGTTVLEVIVSR